MLLSTLFTAALSAAVAPSPVIDLALRVTPKRFTALNPTDRPELVFLFDTRSERRATLIVPARGQVDVALPEGALRGLNMVIATRTESGPVTTNAWNLEALARRGDDFMWIDVERGVEHAWQRTHNGFAPLFLQGFEGRSAPLFLSAPPPATHVPVVTPHHGSSGAIPPRLERQPLPPV